MEPLVVRKRRMHNQDLWWIGRGSRHNFVFYADIHAPTGYGFKSKAKAERIASEIEERLCEKGVKDGEKEAI